MSRIIAFVGPSLPPPQRREFRGIAFEPPARQGDVFRALERRPRVIALVDGVFETEPSVWHHELRAALASGVVVFGASSMGALRAAELGAYGMIGVGEIHRAYASGRIQDDADVALLHGRVEHGYRALTVPWVTVRDALSQARTARQVSAPAAKRLLKAARGLHFHDRTWPALYVAAGWQEAQVRAFEEWRRLAYEDVKTRDAKQCLRIALDLVAQGVTSPAPQVVSFSSRVREERLWATQGAELTAMGRKPDALAHTQQGLRTLLLAGLAQSMGLKPRAQEVARWERKLRRPVPDPAERLRLARIFALEQWVLQNAHQMWADGPRQLEGLALERVRQVISPTAASRRGFDKFNA